MNIKSLLPRAMLALVILICCAVLFWVEGWVPWLEKEVFLPRRPSFMPTNSVWIDAPPLPLSWHHGWWLGCGVSASGATNYCRLVEDGHTIEAGDYLSCRTRAAVPEQALKLIAPPGGSQDMWLFDLQLGGIVAFTKDGAVLLPAGAMAKCDAVRARLKVSG
jgi:hypothetical protein